jgi:hypothetical protein
MDKGHKVIGVQCDQEQVALIEVASAEAGMPVSTWMRYVCIREAKSMGLHNKQHKAD